MNERSHATTAHHVAIALVSCAVLLFEVLITRVLSVVLWYHFVFLSISLAMLGQLAGFRDLDALVLGGDEVELDFARTVVEESAAWCARVGGV